MRKIAGSVVSTFSVACDCGESLSSDTPTPSTNKRYFIQRMKTEGWRFRGNPRQWKCPACIAQRKAQVEAEAEARAK